MSIPLESNIGNRIEHDSPEARRQVNGILAADRRLPVGTTTAKIAVQELKEELESSSSSSIGRDSDSSGGAPDGDGDSGDGEVQSLYTRSLDTMNSLEAVLPIKKGISKFYCGNSKSFTSLADASSCSSIKDIAKSENTYTRKRKNLLAHNIFFDKNRSYRLRNSSGGMSKRAANSNKSTSNLATTMSSFECNNVDPPNTKAHIAKPNPRTQHLSQAKPTKPTKPTHLTIPNCTPTTTTWAADEQDRLNLTSPHDLLTKTIVNSSHLLSPPAAKKKYQSSASEEEKGKRQRKEAINKERKEKGKKRGLLDFEFYYLQGY